MAGGMKLSISHLQAMQNRMKSLQQKAEGVKKKADVVVGGLVDTGIVAGTAFVLGAVQGRTGGVMLPGGVSLELATGLTLVGASMLGIGGRHLHSAGNGALAVHFATLGRGQGKVMLQKRNAELAAQGQPPTGQGVHVFASKEKDAAAVQGEESRSRSRVR